MLKYANYLNTNDIVDSIHMMQSTYYFSNHGVKARTQTPTCYNASMYFLGFKKHLNIYNNALPFKIKVWSKERYEQ